MKVDFLKTSIGEILNDYSKGLLSPVDVAQSCIERTELLEDKCQAWVVFDADKFMVQAQECEKRLSQKLQPRLLEGIPVGVKDIFNTIDFPTQMGSPLWKDFTPGNDARTLFYLRQQGAIVPGKTVTAEFAVHALGKTLNPYDPLRNPGTSSSGSAVAVATGMVPFALGTQTAGSIVRPASFCGVWGCKPSFGLIPRTGILKTTDSLDTVGFFCAHPQDLRRIWDVMRVKGVDFPLSQQALNDAQRQERPKDKPWRIAFLKTHTWPLAETYAKEAFQEWVMDLSKKKGFDVEEVELPQGLEKSHEIHATIYNKTLSYYFKEEFKNAQLVSPIMNELIRKGQLISVQEYQEAIAEQDKLQAAMDQLLRQYDVFLSLSTAGEAPLRTESEIPDPCLVWTLMGLPVVSAPVFGSPRGLPFGLQLGARRYNDLKLFSFIEDLLTAEMFPKQIYSPYVYSKA